MKKYLVVLFAILHINVHAGDKGSNAYNKLTIVDGTPYVIASQEAYGKLGSRLGASLHFVNNETGSNTVVDFGADADLQNLEQIKIDSLDINVILVSASKIDVTSKRGVGYFNPSQKFILSTDGKIKMQITDEEFHTTNYLVNKKIGTLVITGYYDTNNNNKNDLGDKNQIIVFNLKTLKVIAKI